MIPFLDFVRFLGNGEIDFAEFIDLMARRTKGLTEEEELQQAFKGSL